MSKPNETSFAASICELLVDVLLQRRSGIPADFNLPTVYTKTTFISAALYKITTAVLGCIHTDMSTIPGTRE